MLSGLYYGYILFVPRILCLSPKPSFSMFTMAAECSCTFACCCCRHNVLARSLLPPMHFKAVNLKELVRHGSPRFHFMISIFNCFTAPSASSSEFPGFAFPLFLFRAWPRAARRSGPPCPIGPTPGPHRHLYLSLRVAPTKTEKSHTHTHTPTERGGCDTTQARGPCRRGTRRPRSTVRVSHTSSCSTLRSPSPSPPPS